MRQSKIYNQSIFTFALATLALIITISVGVNAQKTTQPVEGADQSTLRPQSNDKTALPALEEMKKKESRALELFNATPISPEIGPANDNFADAQIISGTTGAIVGTNVGGTIEPGEPSGSTLNKTVWYKWTPTSNVSMTFETAGSGTLTDTVVGVYMGSAVNALTALAWNDDINDEHNRKSRVTFAATAGTLYYIQVRGYAELEGTFNLYWMINPAETWKQFNFDGAEGSVASDFAIHRPASRYWFIWQSMSNSLKVLQWGVGEDHLVPGDYDGDGSTDIAVWRPDTGTFWVLRSLDSTFMAVQWGTHFDKPVQGDFDGDDKADFAIWRPSTGTFWVQKSSGGMLVYQWGLNGDYLACGDYDGDGKTDFGIQRYYGGYSYFYVLRSSDLTPMIQQFGLANDFVIPGDYDGDGKNDIAVYRYTEKMFYYLQSSDAGFRGVQWGLPGDYFVPGDYIDSSVSDICIWRPSNSTFYCLGDGGAGSFYTFQFGISTDYPIANSNVH